MNQPSITIDIEVHLQYWSLIRSNPRWGSILLNYSIIWFHIPLWLPLRFISPDPSLPFYLTRFYTASGHNFPYWYQESHIRITATLRCSLQTLVLLTLIEECRHLIDKPIRRYLHPSKISSQICPPPHPTINMTSLRKRRLKTPSLGSRRSCLYTSWPSTGCLEGFNFNRPWSEFKFCLPSAFIPPGLHSFWALWSSSRLLLDSESTLVYGWCSG